MPPKRERFNAKARSSGGSHSHKRKRASGGHAEAAEEAARQAAIAAKLENMTASQRRAHELMQELLAQNTERGGAAVSTKKRKRFEAFVAKQMKKEEHNALLASLAQSSADVADRSLLVSSSTLGTGKVRTAADRLQDERDRRANVKLAHGAPRQAGIYHSVADELDADLDDTSASQVAGVHSVVAAVPKIAPADRPVGEQLEDPNRRARIEEAARAYAQTASTSAAPSSESRAPVSAATPAIGSALAGAPAVRKPKRKPRKRVKRAAPKSESDFDSSASSSSEPESGSAPPPPMGMGKSKDKTPAKPVLNDLGERSSEQDDEERQTDEEEDEEQDAAVVAELKRRGLNPSDYGFGSSDGEAEVPLTSTDKGKGKKSVSFALSADSNSNLESDAEQSPDWNSQTDDELEEEQDAAIVAELLRRGLNPVQFGFDAPSDEGTSSTQPGKAQDKVKNKAADADAGTMEEVGSQTDEELEEEQDAAFVAELIRRGLDPTQFGFGAPSDSEDAEARNQESIREGSPVWEGFASEDDVVVSSSDSSSPSSMSGSDEEGDSSDNAEDARVPPAKSSRSSGFKTWAQQALAATGTGHPEGAGSASDGPTSEGRPLEPVMGLKVRVGDTMAGDGRAHGPLGTGDGQEDPLSAFGRAHYAEASRFPTRHVLVPRTEAEQEARLKLPVVGDEDAIAKTILENPVTVLCGETGSGKTTQVPQFLYERGFGTHGSQNPGMIGVTQPRRVAAVSMANRVQTELGTEHGARVGYQVRYDGRVSDATAVKFMTDGVLLRELATDFLLSRYSVIIIDEAHERSVNTDILIGLLTRIVRLREKQWVSTACEGPGAKGKQKDAPRPLRLIIMSATLRVHDFVANQSLFPARVGPPPVLEVQGRQHEVAIHFNKRTSHDFLGEAVKKVSKIHTRLPPGAILVFLTGQQDIVTVVRQLQAKFGRQAIERRQQARLNAAERAKAARHRAVEAQAGASDASSDDEAGAKDAMRAHLTELEAEEVELGYDGAAVLPEMGEEGDGPEDPDALDTDSDEEEDGDDAAMRVDPRDETEVPMHVLPLYSLLAPEAQMRVFEPPPKGTRLVVVATNVAETSLTIPGVRYVVDCGRAKERTYDAATGVQGYKVNWVSKASAAQRSGRAGRTGPGHCYRLYSAAVFEDHFDLFSPPEIQRTPVEAVVLHMKAMGITKVMNFPFPSPPPEEALERAERQLVILGALDQAAGQQPVGQPPLTIITEQGRAMAELPLAPRLAKMAVEGYAHSSLPHVLAIVAAISVGDPFVRPEGLFAPTEQTQEKADAGEGGSDSEDEVPELKSEKVQEREARRALRSRYAAAMQALNRAYGAGTSDLMRLLVAVGAYEDEGGSSSFCNEYFLRPKAMEEIHKLRAQLGRIVLQHFAPGGDVARLPDRVVRDVLSPALAKASVAQVTTLRKLVAQAFADQVAVRADQVPDAVPDGDAGSVSMAPKAGKAQLARRIPYRAMGIRGYVYLHPSSDVARNPAPKWAVFTEAVRGANKMRVVDEATEVVEGRTMLRGLTRIEPEWLVTIAPRLVTWDRSAGEAATPDQAALARALAAARAAPPGQAPKPVTRTIGRTPRYAAGPEWAQGLGWPLPPVKVVQHLVRGRWQDVSPGA